MPTELKKMSLSELKCIQSEVEQLIKLYESTRFNQLIATLIETAKTISEEFPHAHAYIEAECPDCGWCYETNIIKELSDMSFDDFHY
jgi:predicted Zn-ribbon and HTH transcriptional regulator